PPKRAIRPPRHIPLLRACEEGSVLIQLTLESATRREYFSIPQARYSSDSSKTSLRTLSYHPNPGRASACRRARIPRELRDLGQDPPAQILHGRAADQAKSQIQVRQEIFEHDPHTFFAIHRQSVS